MCLYFVTFIERSNIEQGKATHSGRLRKHGIMGYLIVLKGIR